SAGSLTPPAGLVAPTMKTLVEVEPRVILSSANTPGGSGAVFRITQPGSYYLTANIASASGKHGIEIAASQVTVDLMGFRVTRGASSQSGVRVDGAFDGIVVRNGIVSNWSVNGVDLLGGGGTNTVIENIESINNSGIGIRSGVGGTIRGCTVAS